MHNGSTILRLLFKIIFVFTFFIYPALSMSASVIPEVTSVINKTSLTQPAEKTMTFHIPQKKIAASPSLNLSSLLKQEQSVVRLTNNSGDNSQTALSIRGFGDNAVANTLILVDGFPLTNPSLLAPNFNAINLADIDHIDIIQGSQGTLWGDQAVGGVVNIVTRHPRKPLGALYLGAGSFNDKQLNAFFSTHNDNGFFLKGYTFSNHTNNYRHHNAQMDDTLSAQIGLDYARGDISFNAQANNNTIDFPGGLSQAQYDANPRQATEFNNFIQTKMRSLQLLNKHELNENWLLETRLSHQDMHGDGLISIPFQRNEQENRINPRLLGTLYKNKILLGIDEENSNYALTNKLVQNKARAQQQDVYAQAIIPIFHDVDFTFGSRYASQHNSAEKFIGQVVTSTNSVFVTEQGMTFHANRYLQFFLRRDGNFRFPKANEETWTLPTTSSLQAQTGVSYEGGVAWQNDSSKTQLSLYQLALHNEIAFDPTQTASSPFGFFRNFPYTLRRGVTLAENYQVTPAVALDSQINYVDARFASGNYAGNKIPAVPALNANAGIQYQLSHHWQTRYSALYTGSRYASEDEANTSKKLPGYWLNSVAIQYILPALSISFEINNLFNSIYPAYALFDPSSRTTTYYPGAGRNYLLTLKVTID